jgi:hypothetical protein
VSRIQFAPISLITYKRAISFVLGFSPSLVRVSASFMAGRAQLAVVVEFVFVLVIVLFVFVVKILEVVYIVLEVLLVFVVFFFLDIALPFLVFVREEFEGLRARVALWTSGRAL